MKASEDPHKALDVDLDRPLDVGDVLPVRQHRVVGESKGELEDNTENKKKDRKKRRKEKEKKVSVTTV
jgi:AP-3 complex subunit delta-1